MATLQEKYPGMFYHKITNPRTVTLMEIVRSGYLELAQCLLDLVPDCRERSVAFTHLEEAEMRSIQALCVTDQTAVLLDPRTHTAEGA